jgi:hypothetical protein
MTPETIDAPVSVYDAVRGITDEPAAERARDARFTSV